MDSNKLSKYKLIKERNKTETMEHRQFRRDSCISAFKCETCFTEWSVTSSRSAQSTAFCPKCYEKGIFLCVSDGIEKTRLKRKKLIVFIEYHCSMLCFDLCRMQEKIQKKLQL